MKKLKQEKQNLKRKKTLRRVNQFYTTLKLQELTLMFTKNLRATFHQIVNDMEYYEQYTKTEKLYEKTTKKAPIGKSRRRRKHDKKKLSIKLRKIGILNRKVELFYQKYETKWIYDRFKPVEEVWIDSTKCGFRGGAHTKTSIQLSAPINPNWNDAQTSMK